MTNKRLVIFVIFSSFALASGTVIKGDIDFGSTWKFTSVFGGLIRSAYGLCTGLLIFRNHDRLSALTPNLRGTNGLAVALVCGILATPNLQRFNPLFDLIAIYALIPAALLLATQRQPTALVPQMKYLGRCSYPLYLIHVPTLAVCSGIAGLLGLKLLPIAGWVLIPVLIILSELLESKFDLQIRKRLSSRFSGTRHRVRHENSSELPEAANGSARLR